jgi:hypothetical protein
MRLHKHFQRPSRRAAAVGIALTVVVLAAPVRAALDGSSSHVSDARQAIADAHRALDRADAALAALEEELAAATSTTTAAASSSTTTTSHDTHTSSSTASTSSTTATTTTTTTTTPVAPGGTPPSTESSLGSFRVECKFSHQRQVDPIVAWGTTSAHMHDFFGNASTASTSTYSSMLAGATTCSAAGDTAGYWSPSLVSPTGSFVKPERGIFYYRNRPVDYGTTTPFPPDFRMIAGGADQFPHSYWTCDGESDTSMSTRKNFIPNCGTRKIKLHIFFPSCWDGVRLDSPDHRSHVAYGRDDGGVVEGTDPDTCPATHPVKIPQLDYRVLFPVTNGTGYRLSDGTALAHADFWNTWNQSELERWVRDCLWAGRSCGLASG